MCATYGYECRYGVDEGPVAAGFVVDGGRGVGVGVPGERVLVIEGLEGGSLGGAGGKRGREGSVDEEKGERERERAGLVERGILDPGMSRRISFACCSFWSMGCFFSIVCFEGWWLSLSVG